MITTYATITDDMPRMLPHQLPHTPTPPSLPNVPALSQVTHVLPQKAPAVAGAVVGHRAVPVTTATRSRTRSQRACV